MAPGAKLTAADVTKAFDGSRYEVAEFEEIAAAAP